MRLRTRIRPNQPEPRLHLNRRRRVSRTARALAWLALGLAAVIPSQAQRLLATRAQTLLSSPGLVDRGELPQSTILTVTLHLGPDAAQSQSLQTLLSAQADSSSASYHHWLTPAEFAAAFSPAQSRVDDLCAWISAQGLSVVSVSATRTRVVVSGPAGALEAAFHVSLHSVTDNEQTGYLNSSEPLVPEQFTAFLTGITGLDNLAQPRIRLAPAAGASARQLPSDVSSHASSGGAAPAALDSLADAVDQNTAPVLVLRSEATVAGTAASDVAGFRAVLQQAAAQGITVIVAQTVQTGSDSATDAAFPSSLSEATAVLTAPVRRTPAVSGPDSRPLWQAAPGLPADNLRHEPDFVVPSTDALVQAVTTLVQQTGNRVGNLSPTVYRLASAPGLFSSAADGPSARAESSSNESSTGTWSASEGLGTISLPDLVRLYPRTVNGTQVSLVSSSYALGYGDTFTLTAKVLPYSYGTSNPTGTVTFTVSGQGTIGSATIDGSGTATLTPDVLPVGVYSVTAVYSGDSNYSGASSTSRVTITVSIVNAKLTASIAPQVNVPYGATATATVTVALPGAGAAPSGPVMAQIQGITGALYTATLSPNPGGNTATANIVVSVPSPGSYTVQLTCQGNSNYQCQTPVNLPITAVKGYTNTTVAVTPAAPQAGQPISLTATVANAGNGTASYTFTGSVSFYDSGKLLATAPVATNQATTTLALSGNRTHNIIAIYTGDSNWNTSTSGAVAVSPTILPDQLTLASNVAGSSSLAGVNIVFTATSTTTITYGTGPTGTITFFDTFNGAVVQLGNPATLVSNGPTASIALFTTTGLAAGTHRIYAVYSGDDNYASSTTAVLQLSLSDFSVTMTPSALTLAQGKSQPVTVFIGSSGGFSGTVSLGCTPPSSSLATCTFAPSSVTGGGTTTLTIVTTADRSALREGQSLWITGAGVSLAGLLCLLIPGRHRRLPTLLALIFAVGLSANLGCGVGVYGNSTSSSGSDSGNGSSSSGSGSGSTTTTGTPLGTQNFTITAAGSDGVNTVRHTYQYQVTVQ